MKQFCRERSGGRGRGRRTGQIAIVSCVGEEAELIKSRTVPGEEGVRGESNQPIGTSNVVDNRGRNRAHRNQQNHHVGPAFRSASASGHVAPR